ncbi:MAG: eukaryotic-like serine/threonine-protein kinase, partial [Streptomyces sp.]|nr:eukaryotic-like serine/threonine-protein kinase [Streptomyces sp.]
DYRGYSTAADWIFLRTQSDGTRAEVLNRGFVVDSKHAYSIMVSIPAADWTGSAATTMRNTFFSSFQSVD